jgi:hypothetical protein
VSPSSWGGSGLDYMSTWHVLYNQIEVARYPPMACQALTMFIDGLPTNIVSYITLYNNVMVFLNEPDNSLLPSIHHLFDHVTRLDSNVSHSRLLHQDSCNHQQTNQPVIALSLATTTATESTTGTTCKCSNCGWTGHTDKTCSQPGC